MKRLYLLLGRWLFRKNFIEGTKVVYEGWKPAPGTAYFFPELDGGEPDTGSSTFSDWGATHYLNGKKLTCFATKQDALVASVRIRKLLRDMHEELGY